MKCVGQFAHMGMKGHAYVVWWLDLKEREYLEGLDVVGKIKL
jgi:hypothetical protein